MRTGAASLVAVLAATSVLSGCLTATPEAVADWQRQAAAHGPMGRLADLALEADGYTVVGAGHVVDLAAPITLAVEAHSPRTGPLTFFHATVVDVGTGILVIEGPEVVLTGGSFRELPVERVESYAKGVAAHLRPDEPPSRPEAHFPAEMHSHGSARFFADGAAVEAKDLILEDAQRARLVMAGNATELTLPIRFDAHHLALQPGSTIRAAQMGLVLPRFGYAGSTTGGSVQPHDAPALQAPTMVFGDEAALEARPDGVTSTAPFRLTQATDDEGYLIPADLEVRPAVEEVTVARGNATWVRVDYRERGYLGAAALSNLTVTGTAASLVRVPLDPPPWVVETLWEVVRDAGYMAPFVALPVGIASPFLLVGEALLRAADCLLNDCPSQHPYPAWIEPGTVGRFYYQVDARDAAPGTYEGTIRITGANHERVDVTVRIIVEA